MTHVIVKHTVKDYDQWRSVFDSVKDMRNSAGEQSFQIFTDKKDRNLVFGIFKWDSAENAMKYFESPELMEKMKEAGVEGEPGIYFLDKT